MSGGTWQYQQNWLAYELAPDLREDVDTDWEGNKVRKDLPQSRYLVADLADALERSIHDLDWHFASDTVEDEIELRDRIRRRVSTALGNAAVRERDLIDLNKDGVQ